MRDAAHEWTNKAIKDLEKRVRRTYETAQNDVRKKFDDFIVKYRAAEKKYRAQLLAGEITQETYDGWLAGQVFQGKRWRAMLSDLTETLTHANEIAADIVNDALPEAFAQNANWATYTIEHAGNINTGFGLYDRNAVMRLLRDEPDLLPVYKIDIPKDQKWNRKLIAAQINQGIIQGEKLDDIAKRLRRVTNMNVDQSLTHARTAMTGAQNAGRMEQYHRAGQMGIEMEREWIATLDGHTRDAHALLDGQTRPEGEPFVVTYAASKKRIVTDSIMYPGDPNAPGRMVYNCRCTLGAKLIKYPNQNAMRRPNMQQLGDALPQKPIKDMSYAEWAGWKREKKPQGWRRQFMRQTEKLYTRDEVEKRMLANGIVERIFLPEDIPTETAKLIENVFTRFKERGYPTLKQIVYQPQLCAQRGAIAFYDHKTRGIYLSVRFKNSPGKLNDMLLEAKKVYETKAKEWLKYGREGIDLGESALKNAKDGYEKYKAYQRIQTGSYLLACGKKNTVCETMEDVLNHEYGHMLHLVSKVTVPNTVKGGMEWSVNWNAKNIVPYRQASELGAYAISNPLEAVAEAFAAREKGEYVPDFYMSVLSDIDEKVKTSGY